MAFFWTNRHGAKVLLDIMTDDYLGRLKDLVLKAFEAGYAAHLNALPYEDTLESFKQRNNLKPA